jgi:hypothetical protein
MPQEHQLADVDHPQTSLGAKAMVARQPVLMPIMWRSRIFQDCRSPRTMVRK